MENFNALINIIAGLLIRIGIPLAATTGVIILLRKLDNRWKVEAVESIRVPQVSTPSKPCWEVNNCSPEVKKNCQALKNPNIPCWQFFRTDQGILKEKCLGCDVFRLAPLPTGD